MHVCAVYMCVYAYMYLCTSMHMWKILKEAVKQNISVFYFGI